MKILITHYSLDNFFGSEIFTWNLVKGLKARGYKITLFSPFLGEISYKIKQEGVEVIDDLRGCAGEKFDIIHAQHSNTAIMARSIFPKTPMIFMSHSTSEILERVPSVDLGVSVFIAISQKVGECLNENKLAKGKVKIIKNLIDTTRFYSKKLVNENPSKLMVLSNHFGIKMKNIVEKSCEDLGMEVFYVGLPKNPVKNVEDYINKSDIVVTLGRGGALEAMACERNVIIYDRNGGDGFVTENNFNKIEEYHFSGKTYSYDYDVEKFKKEILKYNPRLGKKLRKLIKEEYSFDTIISKFDKIYNEVLGEEVVFSEIQKGQLYDELFMLCKLYVQAKNRIKNLITHQEVRQFKHKRLIRRKDKEINHLNEKIKKQKGLIGKINRAIFNPTRLINKHSNK